LIYVEGLIKFVNFLEHVYCNSQPSDFSELESAGKVQFTPIFTTRSNLYMLELFSSMLPNKYH